MGEILLQLVTNLALQEGKERGRVSMLIIKSQIISVKGTESIHKVTTE